MIALRLTEVKQFMNALLLGDLFDPFLFSEGSLTLETNWEFDGIIRPGYYSEEELASLSLTGSRYLPWKYMKNRVLSLIRGSHTPSAFHFTLLFPPEETRSLLSEEGATCLLTLRFRADSLSLVTGFSRATFSMDRSAEQIWDDHVHKYLKNKSILFEEMIE